MPNLKYHVIITAEDPDRNTPQHESAKGAINIPILSYLNYTLPDHVQDMNTSRVQWHLLSVRTKL